MLTLLSLSCMALSMLGLIDEAILLRRRSVGARQFVTTLASTACIWALAIWVLVTA